MDRKEPTHWKDAPPTKECLFTKQSHFSLYVNCLLAL